MLTPPDGLPEELLISALAASWDVRQATVRYLRVGFGSHHWELTGADGTRWFVTADELRTRQAHRDEGLDLPLARLRASLGAAADLRACGLPFVVAPVAAVGGEPVVRVGSEFAIALYPFISGRSFEWGEFPSPGHRTATAGLVAAVHTAPAAARRRAGIDSYAIPYRDVLELALGDQLAAGPGESGPFTRPVMDLLRTHQVAVRRLLARYDGLVAAARADPAEAVLTHGEPHPGNTMLAPDGWRLIDWDTALVAPPERDLWMLTGDDGTAIAQYTAMTGYRPRPALLELFRVRWDLADLALDVSRFFAGHQGTEEDEAVFRVLRALADQIGAEAERGAGIPV